MPTTEYNRNCMICIHFSDVLGHTAIGRCLHTTRMPRKFSQPNVAHIVKRAYSLDLKCRQSGTSEWYNPHSKTVYGRIFHCGVLVCAKVLVRSELVGTVSDNILNDQRCDWATNGNRAVWSVQFLTVRLSCLVWTDVRQVPRTDFCIGSLVAVTR